MEDRERDRERERERSLGQIGGLNVNCALKYKLIESVHGFFVLSQGRPRVRSEVKGVNRYRGPSLTHSDRAWCVGGCHNESRSPFGPACPRDLSELI